MNWIEFFKKGGRELIKENKTEIKMKVRDTFHEHNLMDDSFDDMFQEISNHLNNGWRDFLVFDLHIATIVFQRTLLEYEKDSSQTNFKRARHVRRWVVSYV